MDINSMSLDEIIQHQRRQRNQNAARPKPPAGRGGGHANASGHQRPSANRGQRTASQVRDARDVIFIKIRSKLTDARERINQRNRHIDARVKLRTRAFEAQRRAALNGAGGGGDGGGGGGGGGRGRRYSSHPTANRGGGRHPRSNRSAYMDLDAVVELNGDRVYSTSSAGQQRSSRPTYMDLDAVHDPPNGDRLYNPTRRQPLSHLDSPPPPLQRTVSNEMWSDMPPLPRFRSGLAGPSDLPLPSSLADLPWSDPFEKYERLPRPHLFLKPDPSLIVPYEPTPRQPRGILRKSSTPPPMSDGAKEHATMSSNIKARLERAPNTSESMGIFAKMADSYKYKPAAQSKPATVTSAVVYRGSSAAPPPPPKAGYRIVVSNLHPKVVHEDIEELFADIGDLIETRLVRPGIAEVIYRSLQDAEKAVEVYHNRQLDGQPMNCLLVNPRYTSNAQPSTFKTF